MKLQDFGQQTQINFWGNCCLFCQLWEAIIFIFGACFIGQVNSFLRVMMCSCGACTASLKYCLSCSSYSCFTVFLRFLFFALSHWFQCARCTGHLEILNKLSSVFVIRCLKALLLGFSHSVHPLFENACRTAECFGRKSKHYSPCRIWWQTYRWVISIHWGIHKTVSIFLLSFIPTVDTSVFLPLQKLVNPIRHFNQKYQSRKWQSHIPAYAETTPNSSLPWIQWQPTVYIHSWTSPTQWSRHWHS